MVRDLGRACTITVKLQMKRMGLKEYDLFKSMQLSSDLLATQGVTSLQNAVKEKSSQLTQTAHKTILWKQQRFELKWVH